MEQWHRRCQSTVLADGTFLLAACCAFPDVDALFDATNLTWTSTGAPDAGELTTKMNKVTRCCPTGTY